MSVQADETTAGRMTAALLEYLAKPSCPAGRARFSTQAIGLVLIREIARGEPQVSIVRLGSETGLGPSAVVRALRYLQQAKLIERTPSKQGPHTIRWIAE